MEAFAISSLNGLIHGLLLFMVAAGLTLVFGMMGIINFAHASFYMLGAYFAYVLTRHIGFFGALIVAPILVAVIGTFVERYLLRPLHKHGHGSELLMTFGLALVFDELMKMFFGNYAVSYQVPDALRFPAFTLFGAGYPFYRVFVGLTAALLFAILFYLLRYTRIGLVVRAAVQRPAMTSALGHNVDAVFMSTFGVGAWMAGVAGAVGGALLTTSPNMATEMAVLVFVVVVVGGLGSLTGAFIASLLIGLLTSFSVRLDFSIADIAALVGAREVVSSIGTLATFNLSSFATAIPVVVMLVVLLLRPAGIAGDRL
jgi:branched-chain amino acid transport system permease protein